MTSRTRSHWMVALGISAVFAAFLWAYLAYLL
jgi:hypothetical protein